MAWATSSSCAPRRANQAELRQLIAALDTPQRRLMISLRQEGSDSGSAGGAGASARVEVGAGGAAISGRGHLYQSDSQSRRNVGATGADHRRRPALRSWSARAISCPCGNWWSDPVAPSFRKPWCSAISGPASSAVPRLAGDRVTVEISPRDDTPGPLPGSVNSQRLITTVSGRLGEWMELGGGVTEQSASGSGIIRYSTQSASRQRRLLLRIEALD
jgi:hypothetical protein